MSRRSRLSREELEVQEALSSSDHDSLPATPGQRHHDRTPASQASGSLPARQSVLPDDLSSLINASVAKALDAYINSSKDDSIVLTGGTSRKRRVAEEEVEVHLDRDGGASVAREVGAIRLGVDANPPPPDESEDRIGAAAAGVPTPLDTAASQLAPDAELPSGNEVLPNWHPDQSTVDWALKMIDCIDWTAEDRKSLNAEFTPVPELAHLFTPVSMPPELLASMKHKNTLKQDYIFHRYATETFLYNATFDLVTAYKPLLSVISKLKNVPEQKENRYLLGKVFHGMISSAVKIAKGRRELVRRFVPLENAPALYKVNPTHNSIFGGTSIEEALTAASKETSRAKGLVYVPKKPQQPFRRSGASGRGFPRYRYSKSQYEPSYYQQQSRSYEDSQYKGRSRSKNHRRRSRGHGKSKSRSSGQKDDWFSPSSSAPPLLLVVLVRGNFKFLYFKHYPIWIYHSILCSSCSRLF